MMHHILGQSGNLGGGIAALALVAVYIAVIVLIIVGVWKTFVKAGQPGWACLVPFYNMYIMCKIAGRPGWWIVLMFIPIVSIVFVVIVMVDIATSFGKSALFGVGLVLLGFIFFPILGFGTAEYQGPAAA